LDQEIKDKVPEDEEAMLARHIAEEQAVMTEHLTAVKEIRERTPDPDMLTDFIKQAHGVYAKSIVGLHTQHRKERGKFGVVWATEPDEEVA
jgi:hypothetical protein